MLVDTQGIVLKTIKYGETSIITTIFTKTDGIKSFIVNGVRTRRSSVPYGLFQPGTVLEFTMYANELKKLLRLKDAKIAMAWHRIPFDIRRSSVALFICELLEKTIRDTDEHEMLYDDVLGYLIFTDKTDSSLANIPLLFPVMLSNHLGFGPQGNFTEHTAFFDLQEGYFVGSPVSLHFLAHPVSETFSKLLSCHIERQQQISINKIQRREIFAALLKYYSLHIENFPPLRSPEVFQSVMDL